MRFLFFRACVGGAILVAWMSLSTLPGFAQEPSAAPASTPAVSSPSSPISTSGPSARLVLGPGDEGEVLVYGVSDLTQKFRVDTNGRISLALVGSVSVGGMTAEDAQAAIEKRYSEGGFLRSPHVTVSVKDYTNQGITVLGEVSKPGTYSAMNVRRLFDAFLAAGGLSQRAGNTITISHGKQNGKVETIHMSGDPVASAANNVQLEPGDTVIVGRAGIVYVLGEVTRPGGFVIDNIDGKLGLTQAVAMAAGPTRMASLGKTRILRRTPNGVENLDVDLQKVMAAKIPDLGLQSEDIVFVPPSRGKMAAERGTSSILSMVTQLAIYRF